jgi:DNA-binding beta-propeller fold protein YncE
MKLGKTEIVTATAKNRRLWLLSIFFLTALISHHASAQSIVSALPEGGRAVALNSNTNKIYVVNGSSWTQDGSVAVIDAATNSIVTLSAGIRPVAVAVNEVTNTIYIANEGCAGPFGCGNPGNITVVDGATNSTMRIVDPNANGPFSVAVNSVTNKIYVANFWTANVTEIDGATNSITTITDPNARGLTSYAVAVNPVTNKVYVLNNNFEGLNSGSNASGNISVIDGATNVTTTIADPNAVLPVAVAINTVTDKIYVANEGAYPAANHGNITIIDGISNATTTVTDPNALAPLAVAVNQDTNKIYVVNANDSAVTGIGSVTIVDGATKGISSVRDPNAMFPHAIAADSVHNMIFVANEGCFLDDACKNPGSITAINGATNSLMSIIDPQARNAEGVAANGITNTTYVANIGSNTTTVIEDTLAPTVHTLSVLLDGSGSGTVTSNPAGIDCGTSCSVTFATGTRITVTASAASGSFSALTGACTAPDECSVTMNQDNFVTATFSTTPPDFSLTPASTSLTTQPGGELTDVITIAPLSGPFGSAIQLSCTGRGITCALSPAAVTPGANPITSTLTIVAPGAARAELGSATQSRLAKPFCAIWCLTFFATTLAGRRTKPRCRHWFMALFFLALLFQQLACGGSSIKTGPTNYTVTVTATSGATHHTTQVSVTVQ